MNAEIVIFPAGGRAGEQPGEKPATGRRLLHSWNIYLEADGSLKAVIDNIDDAHLRGSGSSPRDATEKFLGELQTALDNAAADAGLFSDDDGGGERA